MSALEHELEAAVKATSPVVTLLALCRAWAAVPSTRVARLARGFARQAQAEPVPGAHQRAREVSWRTLAANAQPLDLQALLATPWSKTPKDAASRLAAFTRLGPDPRVVGALLELDSGNRYASAAGHRFWQDVYELLLSWGSVEAAERVPRDLPASEHTSPWSAARYRSIFEPLALRWAGRWPVEPPLSDRAQGMLTQLEARLAPTQRLTQGLLAAVHAAPGEDSPRLVLADALSEQGDPRGEFITLQFAHAGGELTLARREHLARLLTASGGGWFDGLEKQVAPLALFARGFLREVRLSTRSPNPALGAWSTVESLDTAGIAAALSEFLGHAHLAGVHTLRTVRGATLEELMRNGAPRRFELVEVSHLGSRELPVPRWSLGTLRLLAPLDEASWWFSGSGLREVTEVLSLPALGGLERVGPTVSALAATRVQAVEIAARAPAWPLLWHGDWTLRLEGPRLSQVELSLGDELLTGLEEALASLSPTQVRSVRVRTLLRRGPAWREQTEALIRRALSGQRKLTELSFELAKAAPLPVRGLLHRGR